jgi:hypothetical protein
MEIDWSQFESLLFDIASLDISDFAVAHPGEVFYGFAFDCNSEYGNVLLCLNTESDLQRQAGSYKTDNPDLYANETIDDIRSELRWNMGDWKYQNFNSKSFDAAWSSLESSVLDICMDEEEDEETFMTPTQERFMNSVCRVLLRLERTHVIDSLSRTDDFKAYAADHDEDESDSWNRIAEIRAKSGV